MDDLCYKAMSQLKHFVCPSCEQGILTVVAEVGIESEGSSVKFQSLSAAQGRIYRCNNCRKEFVKIDDEFLELKNSDQLPEEGFHFQKKKATELATVVKEQVRETKQMDVSLTHEELVLKRKPVTESRRTDQKPVETRTEIKIPFKKEEIETTKRTYVKDGVVVKKKPVTGKQTSEN
jgi:uncharacterized protein (TIGR02271 family)